MKPRYTFTGYLIDAFRLLAIATFIIGIVAALFVFSETSDIIIPAVLVISTILSSMTLLALAAGLSILIDIEKHLRTLTKPNRKE
jgi:hypothetical protein